MATTRKELDNAIRTRFMGIVRKALEDAGEVVLVTKSNTFAIPTLDADQNEKYLELTFKVPTGSRDGTAYDGEQEALDYAKAEAEKAEKARKAAEAKAKKIAKDKAARAEKAKAKEA